MGAPEQGKQDPATTLDLGSARAKFMRRQANDDWRRQKKFGRLFAPLVKVMTGESPSMIAWERGGRGEEQTGVLLTRAVGDIGIVLHDRRIPGSRANIDHIAIVPSGVWVIDTTRYSGRVQRRALGGWFTSRSTLYVNRRDCSHLVEGVRHQCELVARTTGPGPLLRPVLCFADAKRSVPFRPFTLHDVTITPVRPLAKALRKSGPLNALAVDALARQISTSFPSYGAVAGSR